MNRKNLTLCFVVLWAVLISIAIYLLNSARIVPFDPQGKLAEAASQLRYDEDLIQLLKSDGVSASSVIHFYSESDCFCNELSTRFKVPLQKELGSEFKFVTLQLTDRLTPYIPSSPAIAVVDEQYRLRYVGPYASGLGCYVGDGNAEGIARIAKTQMYQGAVINHEPEGCYCSAAERPRTGG